MLPAVCVAHGVELSGRAATTRYVLTDVPGRPQTLLARMLSFRNGHLMDTL